MVDILAKCCLWLVINCAQVQGIFYNHFGKFFYSIFNVKRVHFTIFHAMYTHLKILKDLKYFLDVWIKIRIMLVGTNVVNVLLNNILGMFISDINYNIDRGRYPLSTYDFIIVGSGSSGSVLANRLSENPVWKVLLLEVGKRQTIVSDVPFLAPALQFTDYVWNYKMEETAGVCLGKFLIIILLFIQPAVLGSYVCC